MPFATCPKAWNSLVDGMSIFSRKGIRLDKEMWYSVTPETIAVQIAGLISEFSSEQNIRIPELDTTSLIESARDLIILDVCAGVGGNAIQFARRCGFVIATDNIDDRLHFLNHNAKLYKCHSMIDCVLLDALHLPFRGYQSQTKSQTKSQTNSHYSTQLFDLMFLSPPWGGPKYASHRSLSMEPWTSFGHAIQKLHLADTVLFYLPRNVNFQEIKFLSQTGALLQPFRQRRSIIYPSASTDLLEYSDFAQPKIHQDISNQVRFNPLWSWKTSAFALWIGNIGQRKDRKSVV